MGLFGILVGATTVAAAGIYWLIKSEEQRSEHHDYNYQDYNYQSYNYNHQSYNYNSAYSSVPTVRPPSYSNTPSNGQIKNKSKAKEKEKKEKTLVTVRPTSCSNTRNNDQKKSKAKLKGIKTLGIYRPDESLIKSLNENYHFLEDDFIRQKLSGRGLNISTIHEIFKALLELEDINELRSYQRLIQKDVKLIRTVKNTTFMVTVLTDKTINMEEELMPYCDEVIVIPNKAKSPNKMVELLAPGNDKIYSENLAIITDVNKNKVTFDFYNSNDINDIKVDLIFRPRRDYIRYQQTALQLLDNNNQIREYLFPLYNSYKIIPCHLKHEQLLNKTIFKNLEQLEAVEYIVDGLNGYAPYIVFGPPGTGKTTTIVEAILQLRLRNAKSRILITSGSNSACDTIASRLCEYIDKNEINSFGNLPLLRIYSKGYCKDGMEHIPKCFRKSKTKSNLNWDENRMHAYPAIEDVKKYDIVVMTLCTLGKYELSYLCASMKFTHIFIDEAGSISEPEALIGITSVMSIQKCHVILSGDHKQLGPVLKSKAKDLGLGKSLMERLLERNCYMVKSDGQYDKGLQMRLKRNYRSNPEIMNLYNKLYYNNELIPMSNPNIKRNWSFLKNPQSAIAFQAVYEKVVKEKTTISSNKLEIEVVMAYIRLILKHDDVYQRDIGIVTPYKLQCKLIENYLKEENWKDIEVGTVEQYQGREKLIIIASMVRSFEGLGFVKCPQRWNVLLSRPISLLLIMGNPVTMNQFKDMKFVIDQCEASGNYLGKKNLKLIENSKIQILSSQPTKAVIKKI